MSKMFFFGTMRDARVRETVLGRTEALLNAPVVLRQHAAMKVADKEYPTLRFDPDGEVEGVLVGGLTPNDLARIEWWEDGEYGVATMVVHDTAGYPHEALVHATSVHESAGVLWNFAAFQESVPVYLDKVREWMADAPATAGGA